MSKIEAYKEAKDHADEAWAIALAVEGGHVGHRRMDKFGISRFSINRNNTYKGYEGSSSTSSWSDLLVRETERQIEMDLRATMRRIAERLSDEAEKARLDAIEEAKAVINEAEGRIKDGKK